MREGYPLVEMPLPLLIATVLYGAGALLTSLVTVRGTVEALRAGTANGRLLWDCARFTVLWPHLWWKVARGHRIPTEL